MPTMDDIIYIGAPGSSVCRASDSGSRSPGFETRAGHLVWGRIPPNHHYPKGAAPAATTLLAEW